MTVRELKQLLEGISEDTILALESPAGGTYEITCIEPATQPSGVRFSNIPTGSAILVFD